MNVSMTQSEYVSSGYTFFVAAVTENFGELDQDDRLAAIFNVLSSADLAASSGFDDPVYLDE